MTVPMYHPFRPWIPFVVQFLGGTKNVALVPSGSKWGVCTSRCWWDLLCLRIFNVRYMTKEGNIIHEAER